MSPSRILLVVSNPAVSTTTGWPVGFWASELTHPYDAFTRAGYEVVIASPAGGKVELDAWSDPREPSGYSKDDALSLTYLNDPAFLVKLTDTPAVASLRAADFAAMVVAGGQAPMFTFESATGLHEKFREFFEAGKPSAALCHGTAILRYLRNADGTPWVRGRHVTGFSNSEEEQADAAAGRKVLPWRVEDELRKLGANYEARPAWTPFAVTDGLLVTGQQQHSGGETAQAVLAALKNQR